MKTTALFLLLACASCTSSRQSYLEKWYCRVNDSTYVHRYTGRKLVVYVREDSTVHYKHIIR